MVKQTFKSWIVKIKLCKENPRVQLSLHILKISMFSCQDFCNPYSFSLFRFHYFIVNHLYILFFQTNCYNKKRKQSLTTASNIIASKKNIIFREIFSEMTEVTSFFKFSTDFWYKFKIFYSEQWVAECVIKMWELNNGKSLI